MDLPTTFNKHPMLYKFKNTWMAKKLRQKCKPLQSIYYLMYGLKQVPKGVMEKQAQGKWQ